MKKHLSVFALIVHTGIRKVLLVLGAMVVSQVVLFFAVGAGEEAYLLNALERIPSTAVVVAGLFLITRSLIAPLSDHGGRMNNLLLRLGLPEQHIYWLQVLFNFFAYSLFVIGQALIMVLLCFLHDWVTPGVMDPMAVFVTTYQHPLFHRVFPLHDLAGWLCNFLLVSGLSICTAAFPMKQRHRKNSLCSIIMLVYASTHFTSLDTGTHLDWSQFYVSLIVLIFLLPVCLCGVLSLEVDDDGKT